MGSCCRPTFWSAQSVLANDYKVPILEAPLFDKKNHKTASQRFSRVSKMQKIGAQEKLQKLHKRPYPVSASCK